MIENFKYVIFDFDGTLVDSMWIWEELDTEFLGRYGIIPSKSVREKVKTLDITGSAEFFIKEYGMEKTTEQLIWEISKLAEHKYETKVELKPYVRELLVKFKHDGVKMCIATASTRNNVENLLKSQRLEKYFDFIVTSGDVKSDKMSPKIYLECADKFGVPPEEIVVFEDVYHAMETASRAGFHVVAVYDDASKDDIFRISRISDGYINDFSEILMIDGDIASDYECIRGKSMKRVLTIAGSDCSGGAGIQADLKTIIAHKVYGMSVITALTAQNTTGVFGIQETTPEFVISQIDAVFTDIFPDAVKIGMVSNKTIIEAIAERLLHYKPNNVVLDPVMISTSGNKLLSDDAINVLITKLMPLATLITPNIPEAEVLSGVYIETKNDMVRAAKEISKLYSGHILIKGGHLKKCSDDLLFYDNAEYWFEQENILNDNNHGTGCTLSSAIASNLAIGKDMATSIYEAKDYITGALKDGLDLGSGSGPLNHAWSL